MKIARLLSPVHSLGPGERVCLWTQGCAKHCPGCISREMQPFTGPQVPEEALASIIAETARRGGCRGLTLSGGDPLEQPEATEKLLRLLRPHFSDILLYTGYTLDQIREGAAGDAGIACLDLVDVLIDGPYREERNRPDCVLRGSDNQVIHFLNPGLEEAYREYMAQGRVLESFVHGDTTIITGIFHKENRP